MPTSKSIGSSPSQKITPQPPPQLKRVKSSQNVLLPQEPSQNFKQEVLKKKETSQNISPLTHPQIVKKVEEQLKTEPTQSITQTAESVDLKQTLQKTEFGSQLESLSNGIKTATKIAKVSGKTQTASDLSKASRLLSSPEDIEGMVKLSKGDISLSTVQSTAKVFDTGSQVLGERSLRKVSGSVLAPINMLVSGKNVYNNFKEMYEEPSLENLKELGKSGIKLGVDITKTIDLLPGGTLVTNTAKALAGKAAGRLVPLANIALAGDDVLEAYKEIKDVFDDPSHKNIAEAILSSLGAVGSIVATTNIPIVSQIGAGVALGTDLIQSLFDEGVQDKLGQITSKIGNGLKNMFSQVSSWFG